MSKLNQFNAASNEFVGQAIEAGVGNPQNIFNKDGMPGNIATAQGGETLSPAGATPESLSPPLSNVHGALYPGYPEPFFMDNAFISDTRTVSGTTLNGTTITEGHTFTPATATGTLTSAALYAGETGFVLNFVNAYSGNTTSSGTFPSTGIGVSGAGWHISNTSIIWEKGGYASFAAAASGNQVPASGASYFTNYNWHYTVLGGIEGGLTDVLSIPSGLQNVRVGSSFYGSAENSVGKPLQSTATDQNYNIPTDITSPNNINNVGARFFR